MDLALLRLRTAQLLEAHRPDDPAGRAIDVFLVVLILANVVAVTLQTMEQINAAYQPYFFGFEIISVAIFTVEYLLRLWSCVDTPDPRHPGKPSSRVRWMVSPLGLVDLLAILPFYIYLLIPESALSLLFLRMFRGLRLIRVFKLTRYSPALNVLLTVVRKEAPVLGVAASILFVMLIVASWGIWVLERDIQPENFGSIPAAMWWAVVSLTTVGYGDVVPVSNGGKVFAGLIALIGIGMMALPAAILASGFYREVHQRSETFRRAVVMALQDGRISKFESGKLEQLREQLGINADDALNTELQVQRDQQQVDTCPHCGAPLQ